MEKNWKLCFAEQNRKNEVNFKFFKFLYFAHLKRAPV